MEWELVQLIEQARCEMFEPELAAERKVSFGGDVLDASKACHISAGGNARSRAAESGKIWARSGQTGEVLSDSAALNACRSNEGSAESSV
jgi:hypothetical protein